MFNTEHLNYIEQRELPGVALTSSHAVYLPNRGDEARSFFWQYVDVLSQKTKFLAVNSHGLLETISAGQYDSIIAMTRLNNAARMNEFLKSLNKKLPMGGTFICCVETVEQRTERLFSSHSKAVYYPYYFYDFTLHRVIPKMVLTKKVYAHFRNGHGRVLSLPETLGRLVFCGFKIISTRIIDGLTYIAARKERIPNGELPPADGMILKINKIGKDGKPIKIYKLRTMYTFSEYIQKYVYEHNNLKEGGKFNNDFRITGWGRVLRKYWIDELPMLYNLLKGDLKLVGLRPLTEHYLSLYNKNLIEKRVKVKPGLIPPFYNDMPHSLEEIMDSEERYIDAYMQKPFRTDLRYLYKALYNIMFKGARSA